MANTANIRLTAHDLGDDAVYWLAVGDGDPPDNRFMQRLPEPVTAAFADVTAKGMRSVLIARDGDAVVFMLIVN